MIILIYHFQEIDHMMLRCQEQGYKSLAQFGGRAFTYVSNFVMQTAIKVRTKIKSVKYGDGYFKFDFYRYKG